MKFKHALLIIAGVLALQPFLIASDMYFRLESIDVPMHILGGFAAGTLAAAFITYAKAGNRPLWFNFLFVCSMVVMIGAGWEILEYVFYSSSPAAAAIMGGLTVRDLLGDLINDGIGAVIAWYFFVRKLE